jgi:alkylation response protein AidB-like acyl-CoA dehydrogenase
LNFELSPTETELRTQLRGLINEHIPSSFLGAFTNDPTDLATTQRFCRILGDQRLLAIAWPRELGGAGGSIWDQTIMREEMWAHHEPRGAQYMGINWIGPAIMRYGTADQQRQHLPPIAAGEVIWCQGFSEPEAGSDLAALRTSAIRDGDGWLINGQKIWTSYATMAQWCLLLARTSRESRRQDGISIFLVPMSTPGIEVRPIASMVGPHHLNEVFFNGVRAEDSQVLGEVGRGWPIVMEALALERVGIARYARCDRLLNWAPTALADRWEQMPGSLKHRWAGCLIKTRRARLLAYAAISVQESRAADLLTSAIYRVAVTELDQEVAEVLMEMVGGQAITPEQASPFERAVEDHWRYAQASTIASGSIEMQRRLIARALVGTA